MDGGKQLYGVVESVGVDEYMEAIQSGFFDLKYF